MVRYLGQSEFSSTWRGRLAQNIQRNFLVYPIDSPGRVRFPKDDQEAVWLSREQINHFDGLDIYNRGVLGQWLQLASAVSMMK